MDTVPNFFAGYRKEKTNTLVTGRERVRSRAELELTKKYKI